ncbi:MAG: hypothetical protein JHD16_04890 [Solirubrobacteraceae bacterium]|nr:hypothetical protein [Solirubrobacteraceae bacterium]
MNELLERALPDDARDRVRDRLRLLETFPESGPRVQSDDWAGARLLFGPWWFLFIYVYDPATDVVSVTAVKDKRTADGAVSSDLR